MNTPSVPLTVVIGIGNADRSDDGAGLAVACRLNAQALPGVRIIEHSGEGADLIERWCSTPAPCVYLVDAAASNSLPGTVQRFDLRHVPILASLSSASTHLFGVAEAVELARAGGSATQVDPVRHRRPALRAGGRAVGAGGSGCARCCPAARSRGAAHPPSLTSEHAKI